MCKGALPLDKAGTIALPKLPSRHLVDEYLQHQHISEDILVEHFNTMFQEFVQSMIAKKYDKLEKLVEPRFLNKLKSQTETFEKFDLKYASTQN